MTKVQLRRTCRAKQRGLPPDERDIRSSKIAYNFFQTFGLQRVSFLHCFIPIEKYNEVDTTPIFIGLWRRFPHITTVVPRVNFQTGEMDSVTYSLNSELVKNAWEIREPAGSELVPASMIDLVVVPGLAFDRDGHRVGYGKGFYDRFLGKCRPDCIKVGLSFFDPVEVIEDAHGGDIRLDYLVTPKTVLAFEVSN